MASYKPNVHFKEEFKFLFEFFNNMGEPQKLQEHFDVLSIMLSIGNGRPLQFAEIIQIVANKESCWDLVAFLSYEEKYGEFKDES